MKLARFWLILLMTSLCLSVRAQWSEPVRISDEPAMIPRVVAVGETLHVAMKTSVWTSYLRSPDNGETWTDPVVPADTFYGGSQMPDIAYSEGLLHIAYVGDVEDEPYDEIYVLSSSDGGRSWPRRRQVFNSSRGGLKTPRMAVNGDTLFLSCRAGNIWVFRSLDNGESWGDSVMVEREDLAIIQNQNIEFSNGIVHMIMPYSILNDSIGYEVYHRKSVDYGLTWSNRVALSTEEQYPNIMDSQDPAAASDENGNLIATWFDYKYGSACGVSGDILGRINVDNSDDWLPETRLTYTQSGSGSGSIILDGVIHTAWSDEYPNGCGYPKIMYAQSRDWGVSWTEPELITGNEISLERDPLFVSNSVMGDTILHFFYSARSPGDSRYIYYMRKLIRTAVNEDEQVAVHPLALNLKPFPNPFNSAVTICFDNPKGGAIEIFIYDILGQRVKTFNMVDGNEGRILWNARDDSGVPVSSGLYIVKAVTSVTVEVISIVYLR